MVKGRTKLEPQLYRSSQASNNLLLGTALDIYLRRNTFNVPSNTER